MENKDPEDDYFDDEYYENQPHEDCPKCGRSYDDIDFDYQICSRCGWDAENEKFGKKRKATEDDILSGEADFNGMWI
jgi:ribosomal protein L37E